MHDLLRQIRWSAFLSVAAVFGLFVVQNAARIELQFVIWTLTTRRAVLVLVTLGLGFALGWLFGRSARRR
ncbi:MAG: LapA family protein [Pseudomonadota bacterium]